MGTFNPRAAVDYARQFIGVGQLNPKFARPKSGNDCTNFVSQCMFMGGWEMACSSFPLNPWGRRDISDWWCDYNPNGTVNSTTMTWTWGGAPEFARFVEFSRRGFKLWDRAGLDWNVVKALRPGDVLQHTEDVNKTDIASMEHFCIVISIDPTNPSNCWIAQHSGQKSLKNFAELMKQSLYWYAWRMKFQYPDIAGTYDPTGKASPKPSPGPPALGYRP